MRRQSLFVIVCVTLQVFLSWSKSTRADDPPQIDQRFRVLIPAATSIDRPLFEKIATSAKSPSSHTFTEQSLTAELMLLKILAREKTSGGQPQFRYLTGGHSRPLEMAREMYQSIGGGRYRPVTMIQSDRITRCGATIEGDKATGSFDFHVPNLYEGSADFSAEKVGDDWRIVEFKMATIGIHITRDADGKWRRVNSEGEANQILRAAYIYARDRGTARQLEAQLKPKQIEVKSFAAYDLDPSLFVNADLIIIGWDTSGVWRNWKQSGQIVHDANLPVIAMGEGGFGFLGGLKLHIGAREGVHQTSGSVRPVEKAEFWNGFPRPTPANGLFQVLTESAYAGVRLPEAVDGVIPIGQDPDDEHLYPLVAQKPHYFLWGYTGLQEKMSETGKELLAWSCRYAASMNGRESK